MANLKRLGTKEFKLVIATEKLGKMFGLELPDVTEWDFPYASPKDVADWLGIDTDDLPDGMLDELLQAMGDAVVWGTERRVWNKYEAAIGDCLDAFSSYRYEYGYDWNNHVSGVAEGIKSYKIGYDDTEIIVHPDAVHAIHDCLAGYGAFEPAADLYGETVRSFVEGHFHWLSQYWSIYGEHKPKADYDNCEDFDSKAFKEEAKRIADSYGVKL